MNVRGLNTAATLWACAAVGACAGADIVAQSAAVTIFVLAGNTLLRPLVNAIDRIPLSEESSEATYQIVVTTNAEHAAAVRETFSVAPSIQPEKRTPGLDKLHGSPIGSVHGRLSVFVGRVTDHIAGLRKVVAAASSAIVHHKANKKD